MHIPDGYLSPVSSVTMYAVSTPFLIKASREVSKRLDNKTVPVISLFSALSFLIMMFNIPLPGGTTGHAVGATIVSIVLGPWIAMLSVSIALVIQALFFGDGGILTLGANIFNIAIVMSLAGYYIYRFLEKWAKNNPKRKIIFSAVAGYIAINLAALCTGIELGLQPVLFQNTQGQALYFPYTLYVSVPAMMIGHIVIAGLAEAVITGLTLSWIFRTNPGLIMEGRKEKSEKSSFLKWSIAIIGLLIFLSPLGLLAPGTAWGEWGREELASLGLGYIPQGFDRWADFWKAPIPDYDLSMLGNPAFAYILSGFIGVIITVGCIWGISYLVMKVAHIGKQQRNISCSN